MDDNSLDLLRTHNRTYATSTGLAAVIVVDAGIWDEILTTGANDCDLKFFA